MEGTWGVCSGRWVSRVVVGFPTLALLRAGPHCKRGGPCCGLRFAMCLFVMSSGFLLHAARVTGI